MPTLRHRHLIALSLAVLLGACASTPPEATVQVFTAPPRIAPGTTYRHERLPSQVAQPEQAALEATADAALARAGLRRDEAAARLALQLTARQSAVNPNGGWGWGGPSVGIGLGTGSGGGFGGIGLSFPIGGAGGGSAARAAQLVDVQLRDLANGQVVYQSQASGGSATTAAALLQAALADFPNAPPGARQVPLAPAVAR